jgi:hypothetical protein
MENESLNEKFWCRREDPLSWNGEAGYVEHSLEVAE